MKISIRKDGFFRRWIWECPVCHYGLDLRWEESPSWSSAVDEVDGHIQVHREVGQRPQWIPCL